ncbi:Ppx/GppA phosphatase family protein [Brevibacterium daeguense]|uniref:Ppx/GppA phosphatase family protein n=1 Tax=Brevibacterium daeguense TaxID=909936 RepID=A0ABP8EM29_9MICO|nr:Ppx/GppA phosphatase family protein [Brevibacterium daeguense]
MTRVAAFDCGTNSLRLLIADIQDGVVEDVVRETRIVRLGQGVDATGEFAAEALDRTFAVCEEFAALTNEHQPEVTRFVATSASRDVSNRDVFFDGVRSRLGVDAEVISGAEEAELSFLGATAGVAGPETESPYLVMDLGGGSTELVLGDTAVDQVVSMDIGSVRITERHLPSDPPSSAEADAAIADIDSAFDSALQSVDVQRARTLVGVAGTITTISAAVLDLPAYQREAIHGAELQLDELRQTSHRLLGMSRAERRELPYMHPGRADVIGAGGLIFSHIVERVDELVTQDGGRLRIMTSETDILDGIALRLVAPQGGTV